jgi:hypothetical protein
VCDHRDPIREVLCLFHVVGGEKHRLSEIAQSGDDIPRSTARRGVKTGGRLVQEQQLRIADEGERHVQAPALSAR